MKRNLLFSTMSAAALALMFSASASAGTCAAPTPWQPDTSGSPILSGTTCSAETGIISMCQGASGAPAAAFVAIVNIAAAGTFTNIDFTGGSGYALAAYLVPQANGCNSDGPCQTVGDETADMLHIDAPPGTYYLIITGADFDSPGACGTFTAQANGSLPVQLQSFTVS